MEVVAVLAKSENHLRKAINITEKILSKLKLKKSPEKAFINGVKKSDGFLVDLLSL